MLRRLRYGDVLYISKAFPSLGRVVTATSAEKAAIKTELEREGW